MNKSIRPRLAILFGFLFSFVAGFAHGEAPGTGFMQLPQADGGSVTVFYPSSDAESVVSQGPFRLSLASQGTPVKGNGRLIIISHGSGGSPWVHADLAHALVQRGFTVALPQHHGDNYLDASEPGPVSWRKRPREVSMAIDIVSGYLPLASNVSLDAVGVFGGSAGGHTALSLAGGKWSGQRFREHCDKYIAQDFSSCVGFFTLLDGSWLDGVKMWFARKVIDFRFADDTVYQHDDARIKAAIAMVPYAADFFPESLASPTIPLGLVIADQDVNQVPKFHVEAILEACAPRCEVVMRMPDAGHGAMLSPLPPLAPGSIGSRLLGDPPAFSRSQAIPELNRRVADFFVRHLLGAAKD
ncbi:alpha/beta hydrolase family protein [Noviherbaspirillum denitrificans]|uniref:Dienelactone hydrolase n=1 Tax=Noviherbaspirillum denitrificans TaxID=1968433 RepID=A0A254T835_9BURK|nr:dienelactone hydrolase [Noviherbaspirillum denitrificans]OWW18327.1 dienelactone hydrolase [Noviherbaspirillum denitrificans]